MRKFYVLLIFSTLLCGKLFAAEAGMPQLDPKYWASQAFWLIIIFFSIYMLIDKIFIPKIKNNIDARESKIRKDLDEAKMFREEAEKKLKIYVDLIEKSKLDSKKILSDSKHKLNEDLKVKREKIQNEIDSEIINADNEIKKFKIESQNKIASIAENIVSDLLKYIFSEEGNKSSIKATVSEVIKKKGTIKS